MELLIIADDMTGALDCGVKIAAQGVPVFVAFSGSDRDAMERAPVVVIDTESRHMEAAEAYKAVRELCAQALLTGVRCIYKKTDSGLRGNIGAELSAVAEARGGQVCFIPAFPDMGRTTSGGIHRWNGVPIHETVFGQDPFESITSSYVPNIIAQQTNLACKVADSGALPSREEARILVLDAETDVDIVRQGRRLREGGRLNALAGCAGFARHLPELLGLRPAATPGLKPTEAGPGAAGKGMLLVSGSLNQVSIDQMAWAKAAGYSTYTLTPEDKLCDLWSGGHERVRRIMSAYHETGAVLVESVGERIEMLEEAIGSGRVGLQELREHIARNIAKLVTACLEQDARGTLVVFGGDLLIALLKELDCKGIAPREEICTGVVFSIARTRLGILNIVTKSGGFGEPDIIGHIHRYMEGL